MNLNVQVVWKDLCMEMNALYNAQMDISACTQMMVKAHAKLAHLHA